MKETFVKFHVPAFLEFFNEPTGRLRDGNPFPFINTAVGLHNMYVGFVNVNYEYYFSF